MPDQSFTDEVFKSLCEKLRNAELTQEERELLNAILRIAWDVTGPSGSPEKSYDPAFDGCFEVGQAEVIMAYLGTASDLTVTKSTDGNRVSRTLRRNITQGDPPRSP